MEGARRNWVLLGEKIKRPHISHSWGQRDLPNYTKTSVQKDFSEVKEHREHQIIICSSQKPLHWNPSWLKDVYAQGDPEVDQIWTQSQASEMIGQRTAPYKWCQLRWGHNPSLSLPIYVHPHILFFPLNKHFASLPQSLCQNSFLQRRWLVTSLWPSWSSGKDLVLSFPWPGFNLWLG